MTTTPLFLTLTHTGGSSRPCEVVSVENKSTRRGHSGATLIRVRWGMAGVYGVNPHTGSATDLAGWKADPAECQRVLDAWIAK